MNIFWACKHFDDLTVNELYAILRLRIEVFVVEQNCPFQDADNNDRNAWHVMGWNGDALVAYSRILPAGIGFVEPSIGRVVTSPAVRRTGVGKLLMEESIVALREHCGDTDIRLGAQKYLQRFYESFGFKQQGDVYLEDGIEHCEMLRPSSHPNSSFRKTS